MLFLSNVHCDLTQFVDLNLFSVVILKFSDGVRDDVSPSNSHEQTQ